jgi:hypothetical protein
VDDSAKDHALNVMKQGNQTDTGTRASMTSLIVSRGRDSETEQQKGPSSIMSM